MTDNIDLSCPLPGQQYPRVVLAHGGGGRLMLRLIDDCFRRAFDNPLLNRQGDGACFELNGSTAMSSDAFTVSPLFFPGGDIGSLAIHGTANDLAMCGARPRYFSASFILEEGLPMADLQTLVNSMAAAASTAGITIVTGDTKVVERGKCDGLYITTTGIGELLAGARARPPGPEQIEAGDCIIVSGPVGDHGTAIMSLRENLAFEEPLLSDAAPLFPAVRALYDADIPVHCLRDPTRGGLATLLNELASGARLGVRVAEATIPVRPAVHDACELLGLDPLYVACEGRFVAVLPSTGATRAVEVLKQCGCDQAAVIGEFNAEHPGTVVLENRIGGSRVLDLLSGEQLPRIC
ncbi:MAG: hydrogenase expression/formation protein HypE [Gammaproteobacteria bacterium]